MLHSLMQSPFIAQLSEDGKSDDIVVIWLFIVADVVWPMHEQSVNFCLVIRHNYYYYIFIFKLKLKCINWHEFTLKQIQEFFLHTERLLL